MHQIRLVPSLALKLPFCAGVPAFVAWRLWLSGRRRGFPSTSAAQLVTATCPTMDARARAEATVKAFLDDTTFPSLTPGVPVAKYLALARNAVRVVEEGTLVVGKASYIRLYKTSHLLIALVAKHPDFNSLPPEDQAWVQSAAVSTLERAEGMFEQLVQAQLAAPASDPGVDFLARLAALKGQAASPTPAPAAASEAEAEAVPPPPLPQSEHPTEEPDAPSYGALSSEAAPHDEASLAAVEPVHVGPKPPTPAPALQLVDMADPSRLEQFCPLLGLQNPGSLCFLSAPLAVLLRLPFTNGREVLDMGASPSMSASAGQCASWAALASMASAMSAAARASSPSCEIPSAVLDSLKQAGIQALVGDEGDAQEALSAVLHDLCGGHWRGGGPYQLTTQRIWYKADGCVKPLSVTPDLMLHVPIPLHFLTGPSHQVVPLEHCISEALQPPTQQDGDRFVSVFRSVPDMLVVHIQRAEALAAAQATPGMHLCPNLPSSGPDVACPDTLTLPCPGSDAAVYRLRAVVAHQRLQSGGLTHAGADAMATAVGPFSHPVASVVVSGTAAVSGTATLDQGHYMALVREPHSNAAVQYNDSKAQFYTSQQDAATSPMQAYLVFYERLGGR